MPFMLNVVILNVIERFILQSSFSGKSQELILVECTTGRKSLPKANTLAYFSRSIIDKESTFPSKKKPCKERYNFHLFHGSQKPGANIIKRFCP
jgi:hypothetical protein